MISDLLPFRKFKAWRTNGEVVGVIEEVKLYLSVGDWEEEEVVLVVVVFVVVVVCWVVENGEVEVKVEEED